MSSKGTPFGDGRPAHPRHQAVWGTILGDAPYRVQPPKVWEALANTPGTIENKRIRSALVHDLGARITQSGMSNSEAALHFDVTQPVIADLLRARTDLFTIDALVTMLATAGLHLDVQVREPR